MSKRDAPNCSYPSSSACAPFVGAIAKSPLPMQMDAYASAAHKLSESFNNCILEAQNVAYAFPRNAQVLKDVSAQIVSGSFLAILGINGCGKSTLLSLLDDIIRPASGRVVLMDRELSAFERNERAKNIALVAQHSHAHEATVFDALLLGRRPYIKGNPTEQDYSVVEQIIGDLGLEHLALRYMNELSGGEYQKVVIGRALVQETSVLLLDEPTNNLDMANAVEVMQLVRNAADKRGVACAAVMHDINLALRYCDRFLLLKDGLVAASGGREVVTKEVIEDVYGVKVDVVLYGESFLVVPLG